MTSPTIWEPPCHRWEHILFPEGFAGDGVPSPNTPLRYIKMLDGEVVVTFRNTDQRWIRQPTESHGFHIFAAPDGARLQGDIGFQTFPDKVQAVWFRWWDARIHPNGPPTSPAAAGGTAQPQR